MRDALAGYESNTLTIQRGLDQRIAPFELQACVLSGGEASTGHKPSREFARWSRELLLRLAERRLSFVWRFSMLTPERRLELRRRHYDSSTRLLTVNGVLVLLDGEHVFVDIAAPLFGKARGAVIFRTVMNDALAKEERDFREAGLL